MKGALTLYRGMIESSRIEDLLGGALAACGMAAMPASERQRLLAFLREISQWGDRIHLIGKGSLERNLRAQLLDSLLLLAAAEKDFGEPFALPAPRLADIGSGAGFPGLVWKIVRPRLEAVLFERRLKPFAFLERIIPILDLRGVAASDRDASRADDRAFDIVVSKASGRLADILPIAAKLLAKGGIYVTIKGRSWEKELRAAQHCALAHAGTAELPLGRGFALIFGSCS